MKRMLFPILAAAALNGCSSPELVCKESVRTTQSPALSLDQLSLPEGEPLLVAISRDESPIYRMPPVVAVVWPSGEYLLHRCWRTGDEKGGLYFGRVSKPIVELFVRDLKALPLSKIDNASEPLLSHSYYTLRIDLPTKQRIETKSKWWPQYSASVISPPWPDIWDFRAVIGQVDGLLRGLDSMKAMRLSDQSADTTATALRMHMIERQKWKGLTVEVQRNDLDSSVPKRR